MLTLSLTAFFRSQNCVADISNLFSFSFVNTFISSLLPLPSASRTDCNKKDRSHYFAKYLTHQVNEHNDHPLNICTVQVLLESPKCVHLDEVKLYI